MSIHSHIKSSITKRPQATNAAFFMAVFSNSPIVYHVSTFKVCTKAYIKMVQSIKVKAEQNSYTIIHHSYREYIT